MSVACYGSPPAAQSQQLEEVIVTAARREQSVQTASLDLSVVGSEALTNAGDTEAADLAAVVPGLSISTGGSAISTYMRGVGNTATDASAESAIAYVLTAGAGGRRSLVVLYQHPTAAHLRSEPGQELLATPFEEDEYV